MGSSITDHFSTIQDPRKYNVRHKLTDILIISLCAVICGADDWCQVEEYGNSKLDWLQEFLELPSGIPSHDTFGRVFSMIDPKQFHQAFESWIDSFGLSIDGSVVAIDGKTLRRSHDKPSDKGAIHMVSAYSVKCGIVLGQLKTDEKSNEITAIPELIKALELEGAIITIDAMGTQKGIAEEIIEQKADYVLALKGNQPDLHGQVELYFGSTLPEEGELSFFESVDGDHGRVEIRRCWATSDIDWIQGKEKWQGLKTIAMMQRERHIGDKISSETFYYISSLEANAEIVASAVRGHWGIENSLHWVLDVAFREDLCRVRKDHAPENLATIRHMALNLLKNEKSVKNGIQHKRMKAAWANDYLLKVLFS